MVLQHPAALVLLVQQVQRFPIEREVCVVNGDGRLPEPRVQIHARVRLRARGGVEETILFLGGRRHSGLRYDNVI